MTRRGALAAAAAALAGGALAACGGARPSRAGPIVLHLQVAPQDQPLSQRLLSRFTARHRGVRVQVSTGTAGAPTASVTGALTGAGPDVVWGTDPVPYLAKPLLADLTPWIRREKYAIQDFGANVLAAFSRGPSLFMLPRSLSPQAYAVRLDRLGAAHLQPPAAATTAAELSTMWARLSSGTRVGGSLDWKPTATFYLRGWGAHLVDPANPRRCALDSAAAIACGRWMWDQFWSCRCAQGPYGPHHSARFTTGTLAMRQVSAAGIVAFAAAHQQIRWQLAPFPRWPAGPATGAAVDFYGMSAVSPHQEAAWTLLAYVTSATWQDAAIQAARVPPARRSLWPAFMRRIAQVAPPLAHQPLSAFAEPVGNDVAYPPETFADQATALAVLDPLWLEMFGPNSRLAVRRGFPFAAARIDAAESVRA